MDELSRPYGLVRGGNNKNRRQVWEIPGSRDFGDKGHYDAIDDFPCEVVVYDVEFIP